MPETLSYGMVGGGKGAFIGDVHRKAINLDGLSVIKAGCFSRNYDNTLETGRSLSIPCDRLYENYREMAQKEAQRTDGIDFVVIVTPNHLHYDIAKTFLENKIHVVCDKPLTLTSKEAEELKRIAAQKDLLFCVTYTYTGYPLVKEMKELIQTNTIGEIRFVNVEYAQEWLAKPIELTNQKQASWRTAPETSGGTNCIGDIGTHIENMVSYLTGLKISRLCARMDTFVPGRKVEDNVSVLLEYANGAKGLYWCSQIAIGANNGLKLRIFGSKGSLEWFQEDPNQFKIAYLDGPIQIIERGRGSLSREAQEFIRIPSGHPEGFIEAFANIYKSFSLHLLNRKHNNNKAPYIYPGIEYGISGVKFVEKCVESSKNGAVWVNF